MSLPHDEGPIRLQGARKRVFWWHPMPMDYRAPLFRVMAQTHDVRYFFMRRCAEQEVVAAEYSSSASGRFGLRPDLLSPSDARAIRAGVRSSDVFVTSFLGNLHSIWGIWCARRAGKKVVVWEEVRWFPATMRARARRLVVTLVARLVDAFFVLGETQKKMLQHLGVPAEKIFVSSESPGFDYSHVEPRAVDLPFDADRPLLLFVGRLIEVKGVEYLLRAFARVERQAPRAALVIVGDGPLRAELIALAAELNLDAVHFAGFISDPGMKSFLLRRASALVVPSVNTPRLSEGGPLVVLEALSAGLPVIGTDALGSSTEKIIDGNNGYVVAQRDVAMLADRMLHVVNGRGPDRQRVRETFLALPDHAHQARQLCRAIDRALGGRRSPCDAPIEKEQC